MDTRSRIVTRMPILLQIIACYFIPFVALVLVWLFYLKKCN